MSAAFANSKANFARIESSASLASMGESQFKTQVDGKIAIIGCLIHSIRLGEIEIIEHGAMIVSSDGTIEEVVDLNKGANIQNELVMRVDHVYDYTGKIIIPGFVDAHCHAPQYVFSGTGMDLPLLAWLEKYTFPCEARFADVDYARRAYAKSIRRHLKCGTTFASYFATIHYEACKVLVDVIEQVGQRAHVGKVNMDRNSPDFYIEDTEQGTEATESFVRYVLSRSKAGREFLEICEGRPTSHIAMDPPSLPTIEGSLSKRPRTVSMGYLADLDMSSHSTSSVTVAYDATSRRSRAMSIASNFDMEDYGNDFTIAPKRNFSDMSLSLLPSRAGGIAYDPLDVSMHSNSSTVAYDSSSSRLPASSSSNEGLLNKTYTPLVMPCVTPRFVPTCSSNMMHRLGEIAGKYHLPVQSHMSESVNEIDWVLSLHPDCSTYASVYEQHGLLHGKVYMAHCCHSSVEERAVLSRAGASVVHCASSNFMLCSGVMDVRVFLAEGIKVALGTDVAGGYSPSMLDALRQTVIASRVQALAKRQQLHNVDSTTKELEIATESDKVEHIELDGQLGPNGGLHATSVVDVADATNSLSDLTSASPSPTPVDSTAVATKEPYQSLSYLEAFHLATVGGAEVLGMGEVVGNFLVGKQLDCLIVDVNVDNSPIDTFDHESYLDLFQKFLFLGDDRNIVNVFVQGKMVL